MAYFDKIDFFFIEFYFLSQSMTFCLFQSILKYQLLRNISSTTVLQGNVKVGHLTNLWRPFHASLYIIIIIFLIFFI